MLGIAKRAVKKAIRRPVYNADAMVLYDKTLSFMGDQKFRSAYARGMNSGHQILRAAGSCDDIHVEFRVYLECWAAEHGLHLEGDFVCCGVNTGIMPLAICEYVNLDATDKRFWLFDTFHGLPPEQISAREHERNRLYENVMYPECFDLAKQNFAPFKNAQLVRGKVPDTLGLVQIDKVAYLSIDMNITYPERKAIEHFWPKLSSGAIVILDDYGFAPYIEQKESMDDFAQSVGIRVAMLPTGQGMMIKP